MENKKDKPKFVSWFRSEYKVKRWLILAVISVVAICYALSTIFITETLDVKTIVKIILFFVLGFARYCSKLHINAKTNLRDNGKANR